MISQELRSKWQTIRRTDCTVRLDPCPECGSVPELYVVEPVGLYVRAFLPEETFFAARCKCGRTGNFRVTGKDGFGDYIDLTKAAALAAKAWNTEVAI